MLLLKEALVRHLTLWAPHVLVTCIYETFLEDGTLYEVRCFGCLWLQYNFVILICFIGLRVWKWKQQLGSQSWSEWWYVWVVRQLLPFTKDLSGNFLGIITFWGILIIIPMHILTVFHLAIGSRVVSSCSFPTLVGVYGSYYRSSFFPLTFIKWCDGSCHHIFHMSIHKYYIYVDKQTTLALVMGYFLWLKKQAFVIKGYPSKLLLTTLQCFLSSIQSFAIAFAVERDIQQWKLGWNVRLLAVAYCVSILTNVLMYQKK